MGRKNHYLEILPQSSRIFFPVFLLVRFWILLRNVHFFPNGCILIHLFHIKISDLSLGISLFIQILKSIWWQQKDISKLTDLWLVIGIFVTYGAKSLQIRGNVSFYHIEVFLNDKTIFNQFNVIKFSEFGTIRVYFLRRPKNFAKSLHYFWLALDRAKVMWRFRKILWPSQNIWTLPQVHWRGRCK